MPRTPCCCRSVPCCLEKWPGKFLTLAILIAAGIYDDCVPEGEYDLDFDPDAEHEGVTGVWVGTIPSTMEAGCDDIEAVLYCTGTTADEWQLDLIMDGIVIYQDNPNPNRTCDPFFLPMTDADISVEITKRAA